MVIIIPGTNEAFNKSSKCPSSAVGCRPCLQHVTCAWRPPLGRQSVHGPSTCTRPTPQTLAPPKPPPRCNAQVELCAIQSVVPSSEATRPTRHSWLHPNRRARLQIQKLVNALQP